MNSKTASGLFVFLAILGLATTVVFASSPPSTQAQLSGTLGNENWYISNVNVQLNATDDLEGVASTTYWLNNNLPTVYEFSSGVNSLLNPSFEECTLRWKWMCLGLEDWEAYFEGWGVLMWRSGESFDGNYSAAIGNFWGGEAFWHNRNAPVSVTPLSNYNFSVWVKAYVFDPTIEVGSEIWTKSENFESDVKLAQTEVIQQTIDWTKLAVSFQAPAGVSQVYVRLRAKAISPLTVVLFDQASLAAELEAKLNFNVVENGIHTLHFYSTDKAGNLETEKTLSFKIDSLPPQNWQDFTFTPGQKDHSFSSSILVQDATSGVDSITAQYRFYSDHQNWGWSDWINVSSVTTVAGFVKLTTPETDFGDSSTVYRFQFKISDVAGSEAISPIQTIEGPWIKVVNGLTLSSKKIDFMVPAPAGMFNSNDLVVANESISNFSTSRTFKVVNYQDENLTQKTLPEILPNHETLKSKAIPLPQNKLPVGNGIYYYSGNFVIDAQSLSPSFEKNVISALIFIEGNLRIKKSYSLNQNSAVLFVVTGQIEVEGSVSDASGYFISGGDFYSSIDGKTSKQLTIKGGVFSLGTFILTRDLGKGAQGNSQNPAERFIFAPSLYINQSLSSILEGNQQKVKWYETE